MKKILFALLAVVLLAVIGIAALLALVDPNQFKPLIAEQVKKNTGRDLVIEGDIDWRFFPSIGFDIGKTAFRNPAGFAEPNMVQFDRAELSVSVMPLFSQQLEIGNVSLLGGHVFIQTLASGVSNLDGIGNKKAPGKHPSGEPAATESEPKSDTATQKPWAISLEGVEIVDASAMIRDDKAGSQTEIDQFNFSLSHFAPGEWAKATFDVNGKSGELGFSATGETELMIAKTFDSAEVKDLKLSASAQDKLNNIEAFTLAMDKFQFGEWSNVEFSIKGQVPDLAFDTQGSTQLKVNKAIDNISLEKLVVAADLAGKTLPRPKMTLKLDADASYQLSRGLAKLARMTASIDELAVTGKGSFQAADIPVIRFALASDNIDVDAFLGTGKAKQEGAASSAENDTASTPSDDTKSEADKDQEPDLSAVKTVDLAGTVAIGQLTAANAKMSDVLMDVQIKQGVLDLKKLYAKLYQGEIQAKAKINANGKLPTYRITNDIKGVQVQPLLVDVINNDVLAGQGDISVQLSGRGLAQSRIRENIAGTVDIHFADGAIYGINIPEMIREARATLKGKKAKYVKEAKKTDFSAMSATFTLGKGIASTHNLDVNSPLLRIAGQGATNLVSETIDFTINTSVVATTKGQGGKEVDDVADLTVPIDVKGNWTKPAFSLNIAQLLKQNNELEKKAKKEVQRGLDKLFGDKAKDEDLKNAADKLLKGLFN
ncbi:AsmA family protein [Photobacterium nomapromontoriensis]|uniref:AsmA family protein n=1 Tax=Photobacterium nomapromontoriensis TaxID=2910237 RepID=UPI003D09FBDB